MGCGASLQEGDTMGDAMRTPGGLDEYSSVTVIVAETTPVPPGTAACLWELETEMLLQDPASRLKGTKSVNIR